MSTPYITQRYVSLNMSNVTDAGKLVTEFAKCVKLIDEEAKRESLEPIWSDAKVGEPSGDAPLAIFDDPSGVYITVPMIGRRS